MELPLFGGFMGIIEIWECHNVVSPGSIALDALEKLFCLLFLEI